ncbi:MAG: glucose-6-phosphate dehydrogenase [Saprospiraceae bacterium]
MNNIIKPEPTIIFIFGGSGDLANRKLIPALYNLYLDNHMPEKFSIIGLGRTKFTDKQYRDKVFGGVKDFSRQKGTKEKWAAFSKAVHYQVSDIFDEKSYQQLGKEIDKVEEEWGEHPNVIFNLSIAPSLMDDVVTNLGKSGICTDPECTRLVIEKPFGHDLESAKSLNKLLTTYFEERQIYRIDHYLGKDAVQNILVFRFANLLFEPIWNHNYIEHVQITVSESIGVGDRGGYYDKSGALRDMVQNHVLQLLCFVAMEPPGSFKADEIRNRKVDVLKAIRRIKENEVADYAVRGQYGKGWSKGETAKAYREEVKKNPKTDTETFAAVKFHIDNWRWTGVPFYVRSGKRMPKKTSVITIQFKNAPHQVFPEQTASTIRPNRITIAISPDTGIKMRFQAKRPGLDMMLNPVEMKFNYSETYEDAQPEAYETLLHDVMTADATLFMRSDEVEEAWDLLMPILNAWKKNPAYYFPNYDAGSEGPQTAARLIAKDGYHWFTYREL